MPPDPARSVWPRPYRRTRYAQVSIPFRALALQGRLRVRAGAAGADCGRWKSQPSGRVRREAWEGPADRGALEETREVSPEVATGWDGGAEV